VLTLDALIQARMEEHGWSYADLAHRTGDKLTRGRWQQLGTDTRMRDFPKPATIKFIARALEVDQTSVVLAAALSLGLDVDRRGSDFVHLLPSGTDRLSERMRDAIAGIIRAAVAESS
jgi:hypothetical protein